MNLERNLLVQYSDSEEEDVAESEELSSDRNVQAGHKKRKESEEVEQTRESKFQKKILPFPNDIALMFKDDEDCENKTKSLDGRIRTFSHVDGDWASFVYIPVTSNSSLQSLMKKITARTRSAFPKLHVFDTNELHITLSRTVSLRHYWIETIVSKLKDVFSYNKSFSCHLDLPEFYTNDEKTRTFLGLRVIIGEEKLTCLSRKVDNVLSEFGLPGYYENPSFHISMAWHLGDVADDASTSLQRDLQDIMESNDVFMECRTLNIDKILLKTGNKLYSLRNFNT